MSTKPRLSVLHHPLFVFASNIIIVNINPEYLSRYVFPKVLFMMDIQQLSLAPINIVVMHNKMIPNKKESFRWDVSQQMICKIYCANIEEGRRRTHTHI